MLDTIPEAVIWHARRILGEDLDGVAGGGGSVGPGGGTTAFPAAAANDTYRPHFCSNKSMYHSMFNCHLEHPHNWTLVCDKLEGMTCLETMDSSCRNFEFVVSFVLVGITCLFGLIGNGLSIQTLRRDTPRSVTNFLLMSLAVADSAFLIPAILVIMVPSYCEYSQHCPLMLMKDYLLHVEQFGWAIASMAHMCTVYVTVLVAVHRYSWVCRPHSAHKWTGMRAAKIQIAILPIVAILFNIPRVFEYQVVLTRSREAETRKDLTVFGQSLVYQIFYKNVCYFVIMYIIPLAALLFVSVHLILTLRRRKYTMRNLGHRSSTQRRDDNITLVLIIIIFIFVICQTPTLLQRVVLAIESTEGLKDEPHTCGHIYFYMEQIADYMAILNSCVNFVVYVLFARHFRHTLTEEVLSCKRKEKGGASSPPPDIALEVQRPSSTKSRGARGSRTTSGSGGAAGVSGPAAGACEDAAFLGAGGLAHGADLSSTGERSDAPLLGRHANNCNNNVIVGNSDGVIGACDDGACRVGDGLPVHAQTGVTSGDVMREGTGQGQGGGVRVPSKGEGGDVPLEMDKVSDGQGSYSNAAHTSEASSCGSRHAPPVIAE